MAMDEPALFRHRPVVVGAFQAPTQGVNEAEKDFEERLRKVVRWIYDNEGEGSMSRTQVLVGSRGYLDTHEAVPPGDWIVCHQDGKFEILSNAAFHGKYAKI